MPKLIGVLALIWVYIASASEVTGGSAQLNVQPFDPSEEGFVAIFNGRDLTGWQGLPDFWSVTDGAISGHETKEASRQTFLVFNGVTPADFELRLKYKFTTPRGNSGVQFRSKVLDSTNWRVGGYQADFDAQGGVDGSIYDEAGVAGNREVMSRRGEKTIWRSSNERREETLGGGVANLAQSININDWNDVSLRIEGDHFEYRINGHLMTEMIDDAAESLHHGVIAFQLHQGFTMEILFKDVRMKFLSAPQPKP